MPKTNISRARPGVAAAKKLADDEEIDTLRHALPDLAQRLLVIAQGRGGRNAAAQLKAIESAFNRVKGLPRAQLDVNATLDLAALIEQTKGEK